MDWRHSFQFIKQISKSMNQCSKQAMNIVIILFKYDNTVIITLIMNSEVKNWRMNNWSWNKRFICGHLLNFSHSINEAGCFGARKASLLNSKTELSKLNRKLKRNYGWLLISLRLINSQFQQLNWIKLIQDIESN